jgi:hypothetical protein
VISIREHIAVDPRAYQTRPCKNCPEQIARRVYADGNTYGPWRHMHDGLTVCEQHGQLTVATPAQVREDFDNAYAWIKFLEMS